MGSASGFEVFHGVKIHDGALVAAVTLSHRYISDRFLPDKAIDLVDEACAMLRTEIDSMPAELDELTRRVTRMEIEEAALSQEEDTASKARLEELRDASWPTRGPRPTPCAPSGRPNGRRCARCSPYARSWNRCGWRASGPSASTTSTERRPCDTASCRRSSGDWRRPSPGSPASRAGAGCCARS